MSNIFNLCQNIRLPFSIFIEFTFRRIILVLGLLNSNVANVTAGGSNESGINSDPFINGEAHCFELS